MDLSKEELEDLFNKILKMDQKASFEASVFVLKISLIISLIIIFIKG